MRLGWKMRLGIVLTVLGVPALAAYFTFREIKDWHERVESLMRLCLDGARAVPGPGEVVAKLLQQCWDNYGRSIASIPTSYLWWGSLLEAAFLAALMWLTAVVLYCCVRWALEGRVPGAEEQV